MNFKYNVFIAILVVLLVAAVSWGYETNNEKNKAKKGSDYKA